MTTNEMLLRGCMLKNSNYVLGLVVYTGKESRIQMNAAKTPNKVGETLALACAPLQCLQTQLQTRPKYLATAHSCTSCLHYPRYLQVRYSQAKHMRCAIALLRAADRSAAINLAILLIA